MGIPTTTKFVSRSGSARTRVTAIGKGPTAISKLAGWVAKAAAAAMAVGMVAPACVPDGAWNLPDAFPNARAFKMEQKINLGSKFRKPNGLKMSTSPRKEANGLDDFDTNGINTADVITTADVRVDLLSKQMGKMNLSIVKEEDEVDEEHEREQQLRSQTESCGGSNSCGSSSQISPLKTSKQLSRGSSSQSKLGSKFGEGYEGREENSVGAYAARDSGLPTENSGLGNSDMETAKDSDALKDSAKVRKGSLNLKGSLQNSKDTSIRLDIGLSKSPPAKFWASGALDDSGRKDQIGANQNGSNNYPNQIGSYALQPEDRAINVKSTYSLESDALPAARNLRGSAGAKGSLHGKQDKTAKTPTLKQILFTKPNKLKLGRVQPGVDEPDVESCLVLAAARDSDSSSEAKNRNRNGSEGKQSFPLLASLFSQLRKCIRWDLLSFISIKDIVVLSCSAKEVRDVVFWRYDLPSRNAIRTFQDVQLGSLVRHLKKQGILGALLAEFGELVAEERDDPDLVLNCRELLQGPGSCKTVTAERNSKFAEDIRKNIIEENIEKNITQKTSKKQVETVLKTGLKFAWDQVESTLDALEKERRCSGTIASLHNDDGSSWAAKNGAKNGKHSEDRSCLVSVGTALRSCLCHSLCCFCFLMSDSCRHRLSGRFLVGKEADRKKAKLERFAAEKGILEASVQKWKNACNFQSLSGDTHDGDQKKHLKSTTRQKHLKSSEIGITEEESDKFKLADSSENQKMADLNLSLPPLDLLDLMLIHEFAKRQISNGSDTTYKSKSLPTSKSFQPAVLSPDHQEAELRKKLRKERRRIEEAAIRRREEERNRMEMLEMDGLYHGAVEHRAAHIHQDRDQQNVDQQNIDHENDIIRLIDQDGLNRFTSSLNKNCKNNSVIRPQNPRLSCSCTRNVLSEALKAQLLQKLSRKNTRVPQLATQHNHRSLISETGAILQYKSSFIPLAPTIIYLPEDQCSGHFRFPNNSSYHCERMNIPQMPNLGAPHVGQRFPHLREELGWPRQPHNGIIDHMLCIERGCSVEVRVAPEIQQMVTVQPEMVGVERSGSRKEDNGKEDDVGGHRLEDSVRGKPVGLRPEEEDDDSEKIRNSSGEVEEVKESLRRNPNRKKKNFLKKNRYPLKIQKNLVTTKFKCISETGAEAARSASYFGIVGKDLRHAVMHVDSQMKFGGPETIRRSRGWGIWIGTDGSVVLSDPERGLGVVEPLEEVKELEVREELKAVSSSTRAGKEKVKEFEKLGELRGELGGSEEGSGEQSDKMEGNDGQAEDDGENKEENEDVELGFGQELWLNNGGGEEDHGKKNRKTFPEEQQEMGISLNTKSPVTFQKGDILVISVDLSPGVYEVESRAAKQLQAASAVIGGQNGPGVPDAWGQAEIEWRRERRVEKPMIERSSTPIGKGEEFNSEEFNLGGSYVESSYVESTPLGRGKMKTPWMPLPWNFSMILKADGNGERKWEIVE